MRGEQAYREWISNSGLEDSVNNRLIWTEAWNQAWALACDEADRLIVRATIGSAVRADA
jgi:hypothetical protein